MMLVPIVILSLESDGDREFMSELYVNYRALMYKTAWSFTKVPADVDDIISDSCVALIKQISKLRDMNDNEIRQYIVITVRNTAINAWRKNKQYRQLFQPAGEDLESISDKSNGHGTISFFEELDAMRNAIHALPENEQFLIRMKYLEGKSDKEIAEQIGIADSSVRKYLQRARNHIKDAVYRSEAEL